MHFEECTDHGQTFFNWNRGVLEPTNETGSFVSYEKFNRLSKQVFDDAAEARLMGYPTIVEAHEV